MLILFFSCPLILITLTLVISTGAAYLRCAAVGFVRNASELFITTPVVMAFSSAKLPK